jgi:hypothetical protein
LRAQVRKGCTHHLDRADQVGVDLLVRQLLSRSEETVASVVDHDVNLAEVDERLVHDLTDCLRIGVEMREPKQVAILGFDIIHRVHLADSPGDTVAARQKLLGHVMAEAA